MTDRRLLAELLEVAGTLAREAGVITLQAFGGRVADEAKGDGTPVTAVDRAAERHLRERIQVLYPDHGILGEEYGERKGVAPVRWIVDPIDGTRSFMRGVPLYGVLIGIQVEGEPCVGVAHFPALDETVSAAIGLGCRWQGKPARVNEVRNLSDALLLTSDSRLAAGSENTPGWHELARAVDYVRTWGDAYGHALVATGRAEVMVDAELSAWDAAPLLPILQEAGGRFTDLRGRALIDGGSGISTNGALHAEALRLLTGGGDPNASSDLPASRG